ncbi:MAG: hypothetical protein J0I06_09700 [Planctomycetes bacterium]|nr:hypothetical protein [Planctomycetota bacterium]
MSRAGGACPRARGVTPEGPCWLACPALFNSADAALHAVRPGLPILETSGKSGAGLNEWLTFLEAGPGSAGTSNSL